MAVARDGYGSNWKAQRKKALERDGYTCQKCGKKADQRQWWKRIHVHHKRKIRLFYNTHTGKINYKRANRLSNLVTLCKRCHRAADGYGKSRGFVRLR
jgi:5-methylcytosine-specific restriction endonuclease McrA